MKASLPQRNFQSDVILKNKKNLLSLANSLKKPAYVKNSKQQEDISIKNIGVSHSEVKPQAPEILINSTPEKIEKVEPQLTSNLDETQEVKKEKNEDSEEKNENLSKTSKTGKLEPILKQKGKKLRENSRNASRNGKNEVDGNSKKENELVKKKSNEIEQKNNEISPVRFNNNNDIIDFKKFASKFEECTGEVDVSRVDLKERIKMVTSKTFLNIKNLIKPQENIRVICMAFIGLFGANLMGFTEDFYSNREIKEWVNLQRFFENPGQLLNLIGKFDELLEQGLINEKGVKFSMDMLLEFSKNNNSENHEFNFDIIKVLAEFVNSACKYFRNFKINELKISPIKTIDDTVIIQNKQNTFGMETPDEKKPLENEQKNGKIEPKNEKIEPKNGKFEPKNEKFEPKNERNYEITKSEKDCRSVSNTSRIKREKMLADRKKQMDNYITKKKGLAKKNKLERIMNLKVKKPSVTSVLKEYLNKSSDFQNSFSSKKRNEQSFTDGSQSSFHDEIRKAQREIREMEATKTKIMLIYEKQKKRDEELEESQKHKDLQIKEKDDEIKMKEFLKKKKKEEKEEISSFRKELSLETRNRKKNLDENIRSKELESLNKEKERDFSVKKEEEKNRKNKQREESSERLKNIQFIRENKKKMREEELKNQTQEYTCVKDEKLRQKKKEILLMKENLENELFQTLQIFQKGKIV